MDVYQATSYVNSSCRCLKESSSPAQDASEIFGFIKGLAASEAYTYEDLYKITKILTGTVIDLLQNTEDNDYESLKKA